MIRYLADPDVPRYGCLVYCGDLPEREDDPKAVCRQLPMPPKEPLVTIELRDRRAT